MLDPGFHEDTYFLGKHPSWKSDLPRPKYMDGWGVIRGPGVYTHVWQEYHSQQSPHISTRLFLGVWAYQLSCQTLLRAKCIDWFLIAPELREVVGRKWGKAFVFLFSNLTQIHNLFAIYIIPFRFMNYKEESIPLDKNTLKQLYTFISTF